jgi:hypothetical protein
MFLSRQMIIFFKSSNKTIPIITKNCSKLNFQIYKFLLQFSCGFQIPLTPNKTDYLTTFPVIRIKQPNPIFAPPDLLTNVTKKPLNYCINSLVLILLLFSAEVKPERSGGFASAENRGKRFNFNQSFV